MATSATKNLRFRRQCKRVCRRDAVQPLERHNAVVIVAAPFPARQFVASIRISIEAHVKAAILVALIGGGFFFAPLRPVFPPYLLSRLKFQFIYLNLRYIPI